MLKRLKSYLKSKNLADSIVFGSAVKGKLDPGDIDLCLVFREKIDEKIIEEVNKRFENIHVSALTVDNFFTRPHALARTLLFEGKSMFTNKKMSEIYGLASFALYNYNISGMKPSNKVRFVYALKGRGEDGLVKSLGGSFISAATFLVPSSRDKEMQEIMDKWEVKYERRQIMLMR